MNNQYGLAITEKFIVWLQRLKQWPTLQRRTILPVGKLWYLAESKQMKFTKYGDCLR